MCDTYRRDVGKLALERGNIAYFEQLVVIAGVVTAVPDRTGVGLSILLFVGERARGEHGGGWKEGGEGARRRLEADNESRCDEELELEGGCGRVPRWPHFSKTPMQNQVRPRPQSSNSTRPACSPRRPPSGAARSVLDRRHG